MRHDSDSHATITLAPIDGDVSDTPLAKLCVPVFSFAFQMRQAAETLSHAPPPHAGEPAVAASGSATSRAGLLDELDDDESLGLAGEGALASILKRSGTRMLKPQASPAPAPSALDRLPPFTRDDAQMRGIIDELFAELDDSARKADRPQESVRNCKYALAAYLDELILSSQLPVKESWLGRPLQLEYFNDFSAGEEFYNKLEALRDGLRHNPDPNKREVLEVFYLCLAFGFCGKFADSEGREKRKVLIDKLARELDENRASKQALSPNGLPQDERRPPRRHVPAWVVPLVCGVGIAAFYLVLRVTLDDLSRALLPGS